MSMKDTFRSLWRSLEPKQRLMAISASVVIIACAAWLLSGLFAGLFDPRGSESPRDLPQQKIVEQVNQELLTDPRFADVGMYVEWGPPPKLIVSGGVHARADLDSLTARLKELRPEQDYELNVEVLK